MPSQFDLSLVVRSLERLATACPVTGLVIILLVCARSYAREQEQRTLPPPAKSKAPAPASSPCKVHSYVRLKFVYATDPADSSRH
jgi:hypothetical protein